MMVLAVFPSRAIGKRKDLKPYLEVRIDRKNVVEGERLIYEVALVSPEASVAGVELLSTPDFGELPYSRSAPDNNLTEVVVDGDKYYTAVIDRYFVGVNNKGKNSIKGGVYKIGFDRMVKVQYPFWGATVQNRLETMNLKASDVTLKVSPLPEKGRPDFFPVLSANLRLCLFLRKGNLERRRLFDDSQHFRYWRFDGYSSSGYSLSLPS